MELLNSLSTLRLAGLVGMEVLPVAKLPIPAALTTSLEPLTETLFGRVGIEVLVPAKVVAIAFDVPSALAEKLAGLVGIAVGLPSPAALASRKLLTEKLVGLAGTEVEKVSPAALDAVKLSAEKLTGLVEVCVLVDAKVLSCTGVAFLSRSGENRWIRFASSLL